MPKLNRLQGGQWRTHYCFCGWSCRKSPREANNMYKMHMRVSHKTDAYIAEFDALSNGRNGIKFTKHGGLNHEALTATFNIITLGK